MGFRRGGALYVNVTRTGRRMFYGLCGCPYGWRRPGRGAGPAWRVSRLKERRPLRSLTAAVVAAFAANGVVDVPVAAVGAKSQCGFYSLVVGATLCGAGFGLSAFRMCHFSLRCDIVIIIVSVLLRGVGLSAASLRKSCQADGGAGDSSRGCLSVVVFVFVSVTAALGGEVAQGRPTGVGGQG